MPQIQETKPAAEQVHDYYAWLIRDGQLGKGQRVPSVREIAASWQMPGGQNISPSTADRALAWLETDGLVERSRRGTFVIGGRLQAGPQQWLGFTRFPLSHRITVSSAALLTDAPPYIRPLLELEPVRMDGLCPVIRREQVHHGMRDGIEQPVMLLVDWIHPRHGNIPELTGTGPLPAGEAARLVTAHGTPVVRGREGHEARLPKNDQREIPLLELRPGSPVLAEVCTWFSRSRPEVYSEFVLPPGTVLESEWDVAPPQAEQAAS